VSQHGEQARGNVWVGSGAKGKWSQADGRRRAAPSAPRACSAGYTSDSSRVAPVTCAVYLRGHETGLMLTHAGHGMLPPPMRPPMLPAPRGEASLSLLLMQLRVVCHRAPLQRAPFLLSALQSSAPLRLKRARTLGQGGSQSKPIQVKSSHVVSSPWLRLQGVSQSTRPRRQPVCCALNRAPFLVHASALCSALRLISHIGKGSKSLKWTNLIRTYVTVVNSK